MPTSEKYKERCFLRKNCISYKMKKFYPPYLKEEFAKSLNLRKKLHLKLQRIFILNSTFSERNYIRYK